jgi:hypothetical protein
MRKKQFLAVVGAVMAAASCVHAQDSLETFRTLAAGTGVYQTNDAASKPIYGLQPVFGHNLVAAAIGVPFSTPFTNSVLTNEVLAMQIDCESTSASLVVFDKSTSNNIATIATSTSFDVVQQQNNDSHAFPNSERFVAQFAINPQNNLLAGYLTMAGRLQLNPTNGCPRALRVQVDRLDHLFADTGSANLDDPDDKDILRAGVAHAVGVVSVVFDNGTTNKVLLPLEELSIRRQLQ